MKFFILNSVDLLMIVFILGIRILYFFKSNFFFEVYLVDKNFLNLKKIYNLNL